MSRGEVDGTSIRRLSATPRLDSTRTGQSVASLEWLPGMPWTGTDPW